MSLLCKLNLHRWGETIQLGRALPAKDWSDVKNCERCDKQVFTKPSYIKIGQE